MEFRRSSDPEASLPASTNPFDDKYVRIGFIRKVYVILLVQLLITFAIIAAFVFVPELNYFAKKNGDVLMGAGIGSTVLLIMLTCCPNAARSFPTNFYLLLSFALFMVYSCAGAGLFSLFIVMDTQLITGGSNRRYAISAEDYIFGALTLYLDIINLFLSVLNIMNSCDSDQ